jgi:hypothetical protein
VQEPRFQLRLALFVAQLFRHTGSIAGAVGLYWPSRFQELGSVTGAPRRYPFSGARLIYAGSREPTSGLEPLACSLQVRDQ